MIKEGAEKAKGDKPAAGQDKQAVPAAAGAVGADGRPITKLEHGEDPDK